MLEYGVMKIVKVTYDYHYWFSPHWRDKYDKQAKKLFKKMEAWLKTSLEIGDYRVRLEKTGDTFPVTHQYRIDFRTEEAYSIFALCWDSQVDNYFEQFQVKRTR